MSKCFWKCDTNFYSWQLCETAQNKYYLKKQTNKRHQLIFIFWVTIKILLGMVWNVSGKLWHDILSLDWWMWCMSYRFTLSMLVTVTLKGDSVREVFLCFTSRPGKISPAARFVSEIWLEHSHWLTSCLQMLLCYHCRAKSLQPIGQVCKA